MNAKWIVNIGRIVPMIVAVVNAIEDLATAKKGREKQDVAVTMIGTMLPTIEAGIGRDVIDDELVQKALRNAIDTIVALQNIVSDVKAKRARADRYRQDSGITARYRARNVQSHDRPPERRVRHGNAGGDSPRVVDCDAR
ncbi:MAG: hypothetical protein ABL982_00105 [Vicinamibacterales bacterium]